MRIWRAEKRRCSWLRNSWRMAKKKRSSTRRSTRTRPRQSSRKLNSCWQYKKTITMRWSFWIRTCSSRSKRIKCSRIRGSSKWMLIWSCKMKSKRCCSGSKIYSGKKRTMRRIWCRCWCQRKAEIWHMECTCSRGKIHVKGTLRNMDMGSQVTWPNRKYPQKLHQMLTMERFQRPICLFNCQELAQMQKNTWNSPGPTTPRPECLIRKM